jgi:hypothetical protein
MMKGQIKTDARLCQMSILLFVLFGLQAITAFGQGYQPPPLSPAEKAEGERRMKASNAAFNAAAPIVIGEMKVNYDKNFIWANAIMHDPAWQAKYNDGLTFTDAVAWLKQMIAGPQGGEVRALAINNAYQEVYGRGSTPAEQAYWETLVKAQQAWYAPIVIAEFGTLKNYGGRPAMINRAYQAVMGRDANQADSGYWLPRSEHYRLIVQAGRSYLYSSGGATDLAETVARALKTKNGSQPSDADVKAAMIKFTSGKLIFAQMIK